MIRTVHHSKRCYIMALRTISTIVAQKKWIRASWHHSHCRHPSQNNNSQYLDMRFAKTYLYGAKSTNTQPTYKQHKRTFRHLNRCYKAVVRASPAPKTEYEMHHDTISTVDIPCKNNDSQYQDMCFTPAYLYGADRTNTQGTCMQHKRTVRHLNRCYKAVLRASQAPKIEYVLHHDTISTVDIPCKTREVLSRHTHVFRANLLVWSRKHEHPQHLYATQTYCSPFKSVPHHSAPNFINDWRPKLNICCP